MVNINIGGRLHSTVEIADDSLNSHVVTEASEILDDFLQEKLNILNQRFNTGLENVYSKSEIDNLIEDVYNEIENNSGSGSGETTKDVYTKAEIDELLKSYVPLSSIKHVFIKQEDYDVLENYESNTIYLIVETVPDTPDKPDNPDATWHFGDTFPVTLI